MTVPAPTQPPLRIVHVIASYLPATRYGGPTNSVHGLCKALAQQGHDVHVITTDADGAGHSAVPLEVPVDLDGVRVTYFRSNHLKRFGWAPRMAQGFEAALASAHVLHIHSAFQWPTSAAARIAERRGVPYFMAPRGTLVPELIRRKSFVAKKAWIELVEARTVARAARLHVTCDAEYQDVKRLGLLTPAACIVPNGIDTQESSVTDAPSERIAAEIARGSYALFLGRISWIKGIDRALEAIAGTPMRLIIAGNDQEGLRPELEARAQRLGLADRAHFVGHTDGADKWMLLRSARVLLLPSFNENFGNVVVEAMSVACPVVVTEQVGAAAVVRESGAGLVTSGDPAALRAALHRLWDSDELHASMGAKGRDYVRDHLSWDAIASSMVRCYREAIEERRGRSVSRQARA